MSTFTQGLLNRSEPTPFLVYSEMELDRLVALFRGALHEAMGPSFSVFFALKSCYIPHVVNRLYQRGLGVEVMTELEWDYARSLGILPSRIICNGLARSEVFVDTLMQDDTTIIIDSEGDFSKIARNAREQTPAFFGVRLRSPRQLNSVYTSDCKLGLDPDGDVAQDVFEFFSKTLPSKLRMIHCHALMQQRDPTEHLVLLKYLEEKVTQIESRHGISFDMINLGGGFDQFLSSETNEARRLLTTLGRQFNRAFPGRQLILEPGRSLSGPIGFVVTTLLDVKHEGARFHLIVDAGTNVLVPTRNASYRLLLPKPKDFGLVVDIADGITSPDNVIVRGCYLSEIPKIGSRVLLGCCGAYTTVLQHYWAYPPMPVYYFDVAGRDIQVAGF